MSTREDYIYAVVLTYISWQSVPTGPSYKPAELKIRFDKATGLDFPMEALTYATRRMEDAGFAEIIDPGFSEPYIKLNYKPINEYVASKSNDATSPEYKFRRVGKRLLEDILQVDGDRSQVEISDEEPPPVLSEQGREKLIVQLGSVIADLDNHNLTNETKAQADALLSAARTLAEAPVPPVPTIWDLINRANSLAGIAGLLIGIIALFTHG